MQSQAAHRNSGPARVAEALRNLRPRLTEIDPRTTALLVVDMENDFVRTGAPFETPEARRILPTLAGTIDFCRSSGIKVIYTTHVHRRDGSDMGQLGRISPMIRDGRALLDESEGVEIYKDIAPRQGEILIKKHRYSAFFGTDLDVILRGSAIQMTVIAGVVTTGCCFATALDAMFRGYRVVLLSDCSAGINFPDLGSGALTAEEGHRAALVIIAATVGDVMTANQFQTAVKTGVTQSRAHEAQNQHEG